MLLNLILSLSFLTNAALDARYDDYEGYELVRALVDDNKLDLANEQLKEMSKDSASGFHKYWSGVVQFKKGNFKEAEKLLNQAHFGNETPEKQKRDLFLGRTQFNLNSFEDCAKHLKGVIDTSTATENDIILLAWCERKSNAPDKAWSTLVKSIKTAKSLDVLQAANDFLISQKMFNLATQLSLDWLALRSRQSSDFITVADFFNKSGHPQGRLHVLEMARIKYPLDIDVNLNLNQIYYEKGMLLAVEEGFARASLVDAKYSYHAAEINRQTGRYERSQYFNARIPDEKERLKQKLAIYVDKGQFAMIASLESILQRSPLINDDEIRYALAYSLVRMGEYKRPLQYLAKITNKDFLEKTVILRNALTDCVENNKVCKL